jgi:hypothetical protein
MLALAMVILVLFHRQDKNIRLVEMDAPESGKKFIVLVVGGDLEDFPSLLAGVEY